MLDNQPTFKQQLSDLVLAVRHSGILYYEFVSEIKREFITQVISDNKGNLCKAAKQLDMHRNTLTTKCHKFSVEPRALRPKRKSLISKLTHEDLARERRARKQPQRITAMTDPAWRAPWMGA